MAYRSTAYFGAVAFGLLLASCITKEKINCGHGNPSNTFRFQVVDDRTGTEWFMGPGRPSVDSLKRLNKGQYGVSAVYKFDNQVVWESGFGDGRNLPESGGDVSTRFLIRVSAVDTDTIDIQTHFGPVSRSECHPDFHYVQTVEFRYNGRFNDAYDLVGNGKKANFLCAGCGTILVFRKRP